MCVCVCVCVYISGAIDSKRLERQEDIRPINTRTSLNELVGATVSWPGVPTAVFPFDVRMQLFILPWPLKGLSPSVHLHIVGQVDINLQVRSRKLRRTLYDERQTEGARKTREIVFRPGRYDSSRFGHVDVKRDKAMVRVSRTIDWPDAERAGGEIWTAGRE